MGTYITKLSNIDSTAIADVGLPFYNERLVKTTTSVLEYYESLSGVSHTLKNKHYYGFAERAAGNIRRSSSCDEAEAKNHERTLLRPPVKNKS